MNPAAGALISAEGLCFARQADKPILRGASFVLHEGERLGLTGPNGGGKTTLLWLLMGLLHASEGAISILGRPRRREEDFAEIRGQVGLLFQDADDQLFCPTVGEDVAFGPLNLGCSHQSAANIVGETLELLGLAGYEGRVSHKLSGGEKRLVALATVLAMSPKVLLLDEPTSGLDREAYARTEDVLSRLPQAMIIVSHDQPFLERIATRVVTLEDGRLH